MGPADSNNYLDVRTETHFQNQGTLRVDHVFSNGDTLFGRYSIGTENGFSPSSGVTSTTENLPGFGANFDNRSQQAVISWNHIFAPNKVNTGSFAVSRLSMDRTSQNDGVNDIVGALGIQGVGFGGPGAWGAPWFAAQGYTGIGDTFAATPMHAWDTMYEFRDTYAWQRGRHGIKFGGDFHWYTWPMWGFFQNRGYYQYTNGYTTEFGFNDGTGSGFASLLLSLPAVKQRQAGIPQMNLRNWGSDAFVEDSWQVTSTTTLNLGVRYEYSNPLYDKDNTNTNLIFQSGVPSVFVGGNQGYPKGLMYANKHNFAPRLGIAKSLPDHGLVLHASYGIFFTPVDQNTWCNQRHNVPYVFPETQQADNFTPSASLFANGLNFGTPVLGTGALPATTVSFTAFDPHAPAQYVQQWNGSVQKSSGEEYIPRNRVSGRSRLSLAAVAPDQQCASRPRPNRTEAPVQDADVRSRYRVAAKQCDGCSDPELEVPGQHHQPAGKHCPELVRRGLHQCAPPLFARIELPGKLHLLQEPDQRAGFSFADG